MSDLRPRILVIPHVAVTGGAGIYNRAAITALARSAQVTLIGEAAAAYDAPGLRVASVPAPPRPILPTYSGASRRAFLFHALLAPLRLVGLLAWLRRHRTIWAMQDAIVVTSSIDLAALCLFGIMGRKPRRICIIQENARLTGIRGWMNRVALNRMDDVVSISPSWSARAEHVGIQSILAANPFDAPMGHETTDSDGSIDLLFMGGSERIKGIDLFLSLVDRMSSRRPVHAMLLGTIAGSRADDIATLQTKLAEAGSRLDIAGFVTDTAPFLKDSKLLLLPITAPHFCRPAVEAGLQGRTFVVSRLAGLEDFAKADENCMMAGTDDVTDWEHVVCRLLDDPDERRRLALANHERSMASFSRTAFDAVYRRLATGC